MKRSIKKTLMALLMVLTLVTSMVTPVFAVTGEIVVKPQTGKSLKAGDQYSAFKVFDLTVTVTPGSGAKQYRYVINADYKDFFITYAQDEGLETDASLLTDEELNDRIVNYLMSFNNNPSKMDDLSKGLRKYSADKGIAPAGSGVATTAQATIQGLDEGYYLVLNRGVSGSTADAAVISLVSLDTEQVTVTLKASTPTIDKEIRHDDDGNRWGKVGDNQIGDTVEFRLTTKDPENYVAGESVLRVHDSMTAGLTFDDTSVNIYKWSIADGNIMNTAEYPVLTVHGPSAGCNHPNCSFEIDIDVTQLTSRTDGTDDEMTNH